MLSLFLMAEETTAPNSSKQDFICHGCHFRIPMSGILKILWAQFKKGCADSDRAGKNRPVVYGMLQQETSPDRIENYQPLVLRLFS